ncbi:MAG: multicopper oxidase domain-containing protein [Verrucomicrobiales bacterium]|nr:multicopper oxidase domain-containing protein [Verrucomicrobiales bacterium]
MTTSRRHFLRETAVALTMLPSLRSPRVLAQLARPGNALRFPPEWSGEQLTVSRTHAAVWPGSTTEVLAINGSVPGPTIRVRRGEEFAARIQNQLDQPLVLHWHGLLAPERMDGHPRDQVGAGQSYDVRFPVRQRAATCWYHSHTDHLTAEQAYRGVAGLFLIEDPAESALGLPTGDHDIPLVLTDKRVNAQRQWAYAPSMMDQMSGYIGDVMLVNGTPDAWLSVDRGLYRFRLLNGSNARICKVGFVDSRPFWVAATDGGLLPAPAEVRSLMLAPGQRIEVLVDFSNSEVGTSLLLVSLPFATGGGMMGGSAQGLAIDLIRFYVDSPTTGTAQVPAVLAPIEALSETQARRTRVFTLAMSGMVHTINGRLFDMERVEFTVPFGDVEIWEYRNTGTEPHPMHAHGGLGQVLTRSATAVLPAEDRGWKDTVLVNPGETVRVLMRFDAHPGLFVHHCHNLEHEDSGMMQNFEVLGPPALAIEREDGGVTVSWPVSSEGWRLESSTEAVGSPWAPVAEVPLAVRQRWTVRIAEPTGPRFYRLAKG